MHTHVPCKQKSVLKQKAPEENWVNNYTAMDKRRKIPQWVMGQDLAVRSSMQEGNKEADFGRTWKYGPILTTWILFGHLLCWTGHPWCKSHTEADLDHVLPAPRVGPILGAQLHMCTASLDSTGRAFLRSPRSATNIKCCAPVIFLSCSCLVFARN